MSTAAKFWDEATLRGSVATLVAGKLGVPAGHFDTAKSFDEYGLDSVDTVIVTEAIASNLGVTLPAEFLFEHRSVDAVVEALQKLRPHDGPR